MKRLVLALFALPAALCAETLTLRPYAQNGWARSLDLPAAVAEEVPRQDLGEVANLFLAVDALLVRVDTHTRAHALWLEICNQPPPYVSDATNRFELVWLGRAYPFNRWGRLVIDRRFISPEDGRLLARLEQFYHERLEASRYAALGETLEEARPPIFAGFEDDRYQRHDDLIQRLVREFNDNPAKWVGASPEDAPEIPELDPALIKSMMIEETGGNGERSLAAWDVDPLQVNVPGDWDPAKEDLGLSEPKNRNEGTLEGNLRAGIMFLARKGFGVSGRPIAGRPDATFDSWHAALLRYNGRTDLTAKGRPYNAVYAERILRRAYNTDRKVPIAQGH